MAFVAPAGTPLSLGDLASGALRSLRAEATAELRRRLCETAARERAWLLSTGRAAMTLAFQAMRRAARNPNRVEVIIPGYTCYSVPAAIERAGLVPRLCDVDPATLSPDLESLADLDFGRVLAIVSANLYGLPNALEDLETLAGEHGIFMLDDAAQALGARYQGRPVGGFGDVGLFSFDKGKNITTLQGGVLVADSVSLSEAVDLAGRELLDASPVGTFETLCKLPVYALLLRPWAYGAVRRLPLGLGLTPYETDYPIAPFSRALAGLSSLQLERLGEINGVRIGNAGRLREALAAVPGLSAPRILAGAEPVYARYPVFVEPERRAGFIAAVEKAGIGATLSYPRALVDVAEVVSRLAEDQRPTPGAREVASRIVTLPTHGYSPTDLGQRISAIALESLGASRNSLQSTCAEGRNRLPNL
jgi:dTDP-4-amino-4,6-dideoxygalactose transaminase